MLKVQTTGFDCLSLWFDNIWVIHERENLGDMNDMGQGITAPGGDP